MFLTFNLFKHNVVQPINFRNANEALQLPEIINIIQQYVEAKHAFNACLVSKPLYKMLNPFLWSKLKLSRSLSGRKIVHNIPLAILEHGFHTRDLTLWSLSDDSNESILRCCPNLKSLRVSNYTPIKPL